MRKLIRLLFGWYLEQFRPDVVVLNICGVHPWSYQFRNVKGLLLDVDNTLCGGNTNEVKFPIGEHLRQIDLPIVLVSNVIYRTSRRLERQEAIANQVKAHWYIALGFLRKKPSPVGIIQGVNLLDLPPENVAMVGDLLSADVRAANRAKRKLKTGPMSVWARIPVGHQKWHIRLRRFFIERPLAWVLEL